MSASDALLLIATGCPHCPTVLAGASELVKQGKIGRLDVVNVTTHPEVAERYGVRGVPWLRLGPFELDGLRSPAELRLWAERAGTREGMAEYFRELLDTGRLAKVIDALRHDDMQFEALLPLLADPQTALTVRVGIGAVMEEFAGRPALKRLTDELGKLTHSKDAHVRGDAAHFLALTREPRAAGFLEPLLNDPEQQVREIAQEGLTLLGAA
jgi:thiol-disulfide isomerase/thioredoxin